MSGYVTICLFMSVDIWLGQISSGYDRLGLASSGYIMLYQGNQFMKC